MPLLVCPSSTIPYRITAMIPGFIAKKARIDHVQLFADFLRKLHATPDGDCSLLDHSLMMYAGGMGDGNLHRHSDLPCLLVGKLCGKFKTGYDVTYPEDTPMANLLLTILDRAGARVERLGDSQPVTRWPTQITSITKPRSKIRYFRGCGRSACRSAAVRRRTHNFWISSAWNLPKSCSTDLSVRDSRSNL